MKIILKPNVGLNINVLDDLNDINHNLVDRRQTLNDNFISRHTHTYYTSKILTK